MKTQYRYITFLLWLFSVVAIGQTTTQNYTKKTTYKVPVTPEALSEVLTNDKQEGIQYFDGIGRPIQNVAVRGAASDADIVTAIAYNQNSQPTKAYLPFSDTESDYLFRVNALNQTYDFYNTEKYEHTLNAYSETVYEKSPLNRVRYSAAPGSDWKYDPSDITYESPVFETTYFNEHHNRYYEWEEPRDFRVPPSFPVSSACTDTPPYTGGIPLLNEKVSLCVNQGFLSLLFRLGYGDRGLKLKLGTSFSIPVAYPDIDLGYLDDLNGNPTNYKIDIISNNLVISNVNGEECINGVNTYKTIDIRQAIEQVTSFASATQNGNLIRFDYQGNEEKEVKNFTVVFSGGDAELPNLNYNNYFNSNELTKTITKDENWQLSKGKLNTTEEFKDKHGRVVLKRTYVKEGAVVETLDTYYVYDDFGNLTYVLSPEASEAILDGTTVLS